MERAGHLAPGAVTTADRVVLLHKGALGDNDRLAGNLDRRKHVVAVSRALALFEFAAARGLLALQEVLAVRLDRLLLERLRVERGQQRQLRRVEFERGLSARQEVLGSDAARGDGSG